MNSQIVIGTASFVDEIRVRLECELNFLSDEQDIVYFEERENPPWLFFIVGVTRGGKQGERRFACRFAVAKAVSDLFISQLETNFVKDYIEKTYHYCSPQDRFEIATSTLETLDKLKIIRRNRVLQSVYDYLVEYRTINIEGFAKFRLRGYRTQLERIVERTGEELLAAKDYIEFVRLLRCFVELQEPKIDEAHIFITPEGAFFICDKNGYVIRKEHIHTPSFSVTEGEFNYKDYLLSMLITLVPEIIIFHVSDHIWECDPLRTVQQVFEERVMRCPGCERCRHLYHSKKK